ncbi:dUTP diphosphatase [Candidatus Haliotispira prima]|uniref:Deoxyuridine 5'-triphosphate nucleotidohydrolase n=1 Tax=Candidatus Haliotispira prima TaxID=3034016 RepID=A0ABY8MJG7_9SPIO|nr:dUTP diphosphatase [Candidatus Haliotispira prima]
MQKISLSCRLLEHGADLDLPCHESAMAAGADLRAALNMQPYDGSLTLPVGGFAKVPTALQIALPPGYEAQIRPRSGLAAKHGVTVLNAPGTIDADYRGEIQILLINHGPEDFQIRHGNRIAQLVISPVVQAVFCQEAQLPETERGAGGFGSSGLH